MSTITELNGSLVEYFESMAESAGRNVSPIPMESALREISAVLYQENSGDREFLVRGDGRDQHPLEILVKKSGIELDIELLYIRVELTQAFFPALWLLYVSWMWERASEADIKDLVQSFQLPGVA